MAIYHASFQIVKRSAGRSAVAAAAYRSGDRLVDERTGEIHDYTRKSGVDDAFIMTPPDAPKWASDRDQLWSTVELTEKRKDAQLARELNVALPVELSTAESKELIQSYVQSAFVDQGMVADVVLHDMNSDNPHAHVMLTLREINDGEFGNKNRDWNAKDQLVSWREGWEKEVNQQLELSGHDARIDHRSLQEQGVERLATIHLGPHASAMEERGIETDRGDYNRMVSKLSQVLENIGSAIEQQVENLKDRTFLAKEAITSGLAKTGSVLQEAKERNEAAKQQQREIEKERNRTRDRSLGNDGYEL